MRTQKFEKRGGKIFSVVSIENEIDEPQAISEIPVIKKRILLLEQELIRQKQKLKLYEAMRDKSPEAINAQLTDTERK